MRAQQVPYFSPCLRLLLLLVAGGGGALGCSGSSHNSGIWPEITIPLGEAEPEPSPEPPRSGGSAEQLTPVEVSAEELARASGSATSEEGTTRTFREQPDPPAQSQREQVQLSFEFQRGTICLTRAERKTFAGARLTPRKMGRFAVEFYIGAELLERVRFDFPLLAREEREENLERGLQTSATVLVPWLERATRWELVDRLTGERQSWEFPWEADWFSEAGAEERCWTPERELGSAGAGKK